ncbi:Antirepressor N-terminal domain protein OS=Bifidobacterium longum subsp. longum 44B GN=HMPREF1312_2254 PE=4 SV=1: P22_AR_N [Gemmata massiliana]|uniref:Antirepressor protein ant N-terminal domain-containing protein n=1 Tax=Gemmata massiliana TaxID=1210884 RepID=A0A6P2D6J1_9BACT|nr:Antirepressor N-terminal domain protein OS=Bifidobacterium longum subsp. longum 44B GN=HMPREF1312_2254 PE=4 SV=1: P22_AR_N [Gemmata massiliana]
MSPAFTCASWTGLRRLCENIGLAFSAQLQKLKSKSWATVSIFDTVAEDGQTRQMVMIDRRTLLMWLANIDEKKVKESVREKVVSCLAFRSSKSHLRNPRIPEPIKAGLFSKQVGFLPTNQYRILFKSFVTQNSAVKWFIYGFQKAFRFYPKIFEASGKNTVRCPVMPSDPARSLQWHDPLAGIVALKPCEGNYASFKVFSCSANHLAGHKFANDALQFSISMPSTDLLRNRSAVQRHAQNLLQGSCSSKR